MARPKASSTQVGNDTSDVNAELPVVPVPDVQQLAIVGPAVEVVRLRLINKLSQINQQRFPWITEFRDRFHTGRDAHLARMQAWGEEVESIISEWMQNGFVDEANELASDLLSRDEVTRPGGFKWVHIVPGGREVITFQGFCDMRIAGLRAKTGGRHLQDAESESGSESGGDEDSIADSNRASAQIPLDLLQSGDINDQEVDQFLSLAHPVDINITSVKMRLITLAEARQESAILFLTRLGTAFSICCDCVRAFVPTLATDRSKPTHKWVPHHVRLDQALEHFQTVHRKSYRDVEEVLSKHGKMGQYHFHAGCPGGGQCQLTRSQSKIPSA